MNLTQEMDFAYGSIISADHKYEKKPKTIGTYQRTPSLLIDL